MTVRFRLLGEIEAYVNDQPNRIGFTQLRCMLSVLIVAANRPVSISQLVDRVWTKDRLPGHPRTAVQHRVALLRKALTPIRDVKIERRTDGYQLSVDPTTVDLHLFQLLLNQARATGDEDRAAALLGEALELWRGEPFSGLDTPWSNRIRATLINQRHEAQLALTDIELRRGRHTSLLAGLADQAQEHSLDERLAGQFMLALYRSGRPADALGHYRQIRRRLADELGTDPGPPLQRLHQQILTADPALTMVAVNPGSRVAHVPVPRQLPAAPQPFVGQRQELAQLSAWLGDHADTHDAMRITVIGGAAGAGKTSLALRWAHQNADRFPDGQLYVNLRGFGPSQEPMPTAAAMCLFLDALGVDTATLPVGLDAQAGLYRSLVAGKRMLILLDNACDTDQIVALLPGSPSSRVLVTSRRYLAGLATMHGAHHLNLNIMPANEARELLALRLGRDRTDAEPEPVANLLACCAGLPLAISIVATRAAAHPDFPLAVLAEELREAGTRLDALQTSDLTANMRAVLSWSYNSLDAATARVFALLGRCPGPDISLSEATSRTGLSTDGTRKALRDLESAYLIQAHVPNRYRMHDLIRLYASEQGRPQS